MKQNKFIIITLLAAVLFGGCSDFLKENPTDQITPEDAYSDPTLIYLNSVANLYTLIGAEGGNRGLAGTDRSVYDLCELSSDEFILPTRGGDWYDGGLWQELYSTNWQTTNGIIKDSWNYLYEVIGKVNASVDLLSDLREKDPKNSDNYNYFISELRAFRAMYYFYIVDMYGNVPLVISSKTPIAEVKQSSRKEVFEFIIKELQESAPLLENKRSNKEGLYYGRITKPVAYYLLAKVALNAQVYNDEDYTDNGGVPNGAATIKKDGKDIPAWDAVIEYCDSVAKAGYMLETNFSDNFKVGNEDSDENIFTIPMDPIKYKTQFMYNVRSMHYAHAEACGYQGWNGASLTKEAFEIFENSKNTYGDTRLDKSFYYGEVFAPNGDPVMYTATIDEKETSLPLVYAPNEVKLDVSGTEYEKTAGARWCKYELDPGYAGGGMLVSNDFVLYRYADVLLMKAEAKIRKGESGLDELKAVAKRSSSTKYDIVTNPTLEDVLEERLLELSWEGISRRNDVIRFGKFTRAITDRPSPEPYKMVFPIPDDVLKANLNLKQNKGYN